MSNVEAGLTFPCPEATSSSPRRHLINPALITLARGGRTGSIGIGSCYGTFGELLQGVLPEDDGDFLVSLPITASSTASFRWTPDTDGIRVQPAHKVKSVKIAALVLEHFRAAKAGSLRIDSDLPEGKGLASSTADLVATARAVSNALGAVLTPALLEELLRKIEPTDGVLYPGIVAMNHRAVRLRASLGTLPALTIVGIDEGGVVDTIKFNKTPKSFSAAARREYAVLLDSITAAVARNDLVSVGKIATRSALMNQDVLPKQDLEAVLGICRDIGALGVVAAHSGTMLGIMLDSLDLRYRERLSSVLDGAAAISGDVSVYHTAELR